MLVMYLFFQAMLLSPTVSAHKGIHKKAPPDPIVIVGSGLAAHSAAAEILDKYSELDEASSALLPRVVILEKEPRFGGNSLKATSGINGALSSFQREAGIEDSLEDFQRDVMYSCTGDKRAAVNKKVGILTGESGAAVDWLRSKFELDISSISQCGGHSHPRTHRPPRGPAGFTIVKTIHTFLESHHLKHQIEFRYNSRVTELVTDTETKAVIGVKFSDSEEKEQWLKASAVVLATGGFANDHSAKGSLLAEFGTDIGQESTLPTTNGPWATGDGVKMARQIGAHLVDMNYIQIHPTGFVDPSDRDASTKFLAPEALRGSGGLLLNAVGERFVNELDLRSKVVAAERSQRKGAIRLALNQAAADLFGPNLGFYLGKKLFVRYDSWLQMAEATSMSMEALSENVAYYNAVAAASGKQSAVGEHITDKFGKSVFPVKEFDLKQPVYVATVTPVIHYTMGGLQMTDSAQIVDLSGDAIPALFGAGEVTGGIHGRNRLAGNSLLECVVFGRTAARSALHFVRNLTEARAHDEL